MVPARQVGFLNPGNPCQWLGRLTALRGQGLAPRSLSPAVEAPSSISDVPSPTSRYSPWRPTHQRPDGEGGREGPRSLWAPPSLSKGRALQRQGLGADGRRLSCGAPEGVRRRARSAGAGAQRLPCDSRARRLPDPTGRGRVGCPASAPPRQAEGGGRRGNLGSSGPPLSNHFPRL